MHLPSLLDMLEHVMRSVGSGSPQTSWFTHVIVTVFKVSSGAQPKIAEVEVKFRRTPLTGIDGRLVQLTENTSLSHAEVQRVNVS